MSGALLASLMAPRIVSVITRTVYIEQGNPTVAANETWAVVHALGRGGTPVITAPVGARCGDGGGVGQGSIIPVSAGQVITLSIGQIQRDGLLMVTVGDGGSGTGAAATTGSFVRNSGDAYTPPVTRFLTGAIADPANPANPDYAGKAGLAGGGVVLNRQVSPGVFASGVEAGGDGDALVTFYTADPR